MPIIEANGLSKFYRVFQKKEGLLGALGVGRHPPILAAPTPPHTRFARGVDKNGPLADPSS